MVRVESKRAHGQSCAPQLGPSAVHPHSIATARQRFQGYREALEVLPDFILARDH